MEGPHTLQVNLQRPALRERPRAHSMGREFVSMVRSRLRAKSRAKMRKARAKMRKARAKMRKAQAKRLEMRKLREKSVEIRKLREKSLEMSKMSGHTLRSILP